MAILEIKDLVVSFDGFHAVDGLDLAVEEGELRFLIGPNGAGKTTLIDAITGLAKAASGSMRFDGRELLGRREHQIVRDGIGRTFQTPTVFEQLTVLENIDLAATFRLPLRRLARRRRGVDDSVAEALHTVGLGAKAGLAAGVLSHGQKQWLEIGMLLVQEPRILLLDEPVAGMSKEERTETGALLQMIAKTRTLIVVEHDMDFLRRFASTVTVMNEGRILCEGSVADVQANPVVQEVYLGRAHDRRGRLEVA
ncbi:MAG: urea transport system ATP-binding protein [Solirubrobacteraceae bacterium]|nr:urea transport system ATP-binding protein [Solirubrobacteraceae bacterium]